MFYDINKVVIEDMGKHPYLYVMYNKELLGCTPLNVPTDEMALLLVAYDLMYYTENESACHDVIYLNFFLDNIEDVTYFLKERDGD